MHRNTRYSWRNYLYIYSNKFEITVQTLVEKLCIRERQLLILVKV